MREVLDQIVLANIMGLHRKLAEYPRLKYALLHHRNLHNKPMAFHDKPYLVEIYKDSCPNIAIQASVQTGKSEFFIVAVLEAAERGLQVMYVLPTDQIRNLFVGNRIDPLFKRIPHYAEVMAMSDGLKNNASLKQYGKGAIFFAGSNSEVTFIEKPLDMIIGDEIDRFDLVNYQKADDRMTASEYKVKYQASNPTVEKYGINREYLKSNQMQHFVKCKHCSYWQTLDWFKNVVRQTDSNDYVLHDTTWERGCGRDINVVCVKCHKPLERFTHKSGWVAKVKNDDSHGYLIHQMMSSYVKIESMYWKFVEGQGDDTVMQVFFNSMLGLPFAGKGAKLTDEILNKCKSDYLMPAEWRGPCTMGVDVGKWLHVVINAIMPGDRLRKVYVGRVKEFEELDIFFARFNIVSYVIDSMPETRKATEYAKKHTGRGWICRYNHGLKEHGEDNEGRIVSTDRTQIMDRVMHFFVNRKMELPANAQTLDRGEYYELLKTPTRVFDQERHEFLYLGDPDHYYHAEVYALLAYIIRGEFKVWGIPAGVPVTPKMEAFDASMFPPGTPGWMIEQHRVLYEQALLSAKMNE